MIRQLAGSALAVSFAMTASLVTRSAAAQNLPTLATFLDASRKHAPDNREARAIADQRDHEEASARSRLWPTFTASVGYTRNQYEDAARFPDGQGGTREVTITPKDQFDTTLTLDLPLLDFTTWSRVSAADAERRASLAQVDATRDTIDRQVGQAYYQLVAAAALVTSGQQAQATAEQDLSRVQVRLDAGLASELDVERARAEVARNRQTVAEAELLRTQAMRKLRSLSGLEPQGLIPELPQNTAQEPPRRFWLAGVSHVPSVRAAAEHAVASAALHDAAYRAYLPTLVGSARERFTNAVGFGNSPAWSVGVTAVWRLDLGAVANEGAQAAALDAARAAAARARQTAQDAIEDAFEQVETERVRVEAARAEEDASARASQVAQTRYDAGTVTHLDLVQAERDAFSGRVARLQAEANLAFARFALRVAAGKLEGARR